MPVTARTIDQVREYYARVLQSGRDLKTNACCPADSLPSHHSEIVSLIDDEILDRFYGCGSPIPSELAGRKVIDLGCGTGRDSYIASCLVGPEGGVVGVDMTDEQLDVARRHVGEQMSRFGFLRPNVEFKKGYIEDLSGAGIKDDSIDVVISNCVINLSPDKRAVFSEIFRVLRPGGELYFSDVFAGRRVPDSLREDPEFYGECLGGALYIEDFRRLLDNLGCVDHRVVSMRKIDIDNPEIAQRTGPVDFYSMTVRAFKLSDLEDVCEDYGQAAVYLGTIPEFPHEFQLDDHHFFETGRSVLVCGNTASMLQNTRYSKHFKVTGDRSIHFGPFDCETSPSELGDGESGLPGGACC